MGAIQSQDDMASPESSKAVAPRSSPGSFRSTTSSSASGSGAWDPETAKPKRSLSKVNSVSRGTESPHNKSLAADKMQELIKHEANLNTSLSSKFLAVGSVAEDEEMPDVDPSSPGARMMSNKFSLGPVGDQMVSPFACTDLKTSTEVWNIKIASRTVGEYGADGGALSVHSAKGHRLPINAVALHPDGSTVVVASATGETMVLDIAGTLSPRPPDKCPAPLRLSVSSVAVHPEGKLIATGSWDKGLRLLDIATGAEVDSSTAHQSFVTALAFSPGGAFLASGGGDKPVIRVWEIDTSKGEGLLVEKCVLPGHWGNITCLCFSHDESTLASCASDGTIRIWDVINGDPPADMGFEAQSSAQSRTRLHWAAVGDVSFREMEAEIVNDDAEHRYKWKTEHASGGYLHMCHVFDADGCGRQNEGRFQYVDATSGEIIYTSTGWLRTLKGHHGRVNQVVYSPNGDALASVGDDGTVRVWDAQSTRNTDLIMDDRFAEGTAGYHILSIEDEMAPGDDGPCSMKIEVDDEELKFSVEFPEGGYYYRHGSGNRPENLKKVLAPHAGWADRMKHPLYKIKRQPSGRILFDWDSSKVVLRGHSAPVRGVAFIHGGTQILSASEDMTLRLWDVELGTCQCVLNADCSFSCLNVLIRPPLLAAGDLKGNVHLIDGKDFDGARFLPDEERATRNGSLKKRFI